MAHSPAFRYSEIARRFHARQTRDGLLRSHTPGACVQVAAAIVREDRAPERCVDLGLPFRVGEADVGELAQAHAGELASQNLAFAPDVPQMAQDNDGDHHDR